MFALQQHRTRKQSNHTPARRAPENDTLRRARRPRAAAPAALRAADSAGHTHVTASGAKKPARQASSEGAPLPARSGPPHALSPAEQASASFNPVHGFDVVAGLRQDVTAELVAQPVSGTCCVSACATGRKA